MSHPQPISVYIDAAQTHTGRPRADVDRQINGLPDRLRIYPAGATGPYLSMTPADWDILCAVVAEARADAAAGRS